MKVNLPLVTTPLIMKVITATLTPTHTRQSRELIMDTHMRDAITIMVDTHISHPVMLILIPLIQMPPPQSTMISPPCLTSSQMHSHTHIHAHTHTVINMHTSIHMSAHIIISHHPLILLFLRLLSEWSSTTLQPPSLSPPPMHSCSFLLLLFPSTPIQHRYVCILGMGCNCLIVGVCAATSL